MKNKLTLLISLFILVGLPACKDDECLTCPDNEAVVNGQCKCIGISFKGECRDKTSAFEPKFVFPETVQFDPFLSKASECNSIFDFNNQPMFLYLSVVGVYDNRAGAMIAIETEARPSDNHHIKAYFSEVVSELGRSNFDSLSYYWPSAYDYSGMVYTGENGRGNFGEHYTTEIDGETCYLRPYVKILDQDVLRVTFRYVTSDEEVRAECVRLFIR